MPIWYQSTACELMLVTVASCPVLLPHVLSRFNGRTGASVLEVVSVEFNSGGSFGLMSLNS